MNTMTEHHENPPELDPRQALMESLDRLRDRHGFSVAEMARRIDYDPSALCRMLKGQRRPTLDVMRRLLIVFGEPDDAGFFRRRCAGTPSSSAPAA